MTQDYQARAAEAAEQAPARQIQLVRHETRRRTLLVSRVEDLTPGMRRIHFSSAELTDFTSLSPDDHIKLFLEDSDGQSLMRDYTPRSFDNAAGTLVIDFAVHQAGPATAWALAARPGDTLQIGGPRGSAILPDIFDWYVLIGDETALPAIGRRIEELRPGVPATTLVTVDTARDIQTFQTAADWSADWLCRDIEGQDDAASLRRAIDRLFPRSGDGFVWIAAEAQVARTLRAHILERHGHPAQQMKAAGYWVRGRDGAHQTLD